MVLKCPLHLQEAAAKAAAEQAVEMDVESDSDDEHQEIRNEVSCFNMVRFINACANRIFKE